MLVMVCYKAIFSCLIHSSKKRILWTVHTVHGLCTHTWIVMPPEPASLLIAILSSWALQKWWDLLASCWLDTCRKSRSLEDLVQSYLFEMLRLWWSYYCNCSMLQYILLSKIRILGRNFKTLWVLMCLHTFYSLTYKLWFSMNFPCSVSLFPLFCSVFV